jgi:Fe2+ or Zn2+ uptake regulation protein
MDDVIEARQQQIADQYQFQMTDHSLTIYGICQGCAA